jgi:hypothetical protein
MEDDLTARVEGHIVERPISEIMQEANKLSLELHESIKEKNPKLAQLLSIIHVATRNGHLTGGYIKENLAPFLRSRGLEIFSNGREVSVNLNWSSKDQMMREFRNQKEEQDHQGNADLAFRIGGLLQSVYDKIKLSVGEDSPELHALDLAKGLAMVVRDELNGEEMKGFVFMPLFKECLQKFGIEISLKEQNQKEPFSVS